MCSNVGATDIRPTGLLGVVVAVVLLLQFASPGAGAVPLSDFFPFNATFGDNATNSSDDGGSGEIKLRSGFPFFNRTHDKIFVNNNGIISFLDELKTYKPENFPLKTDNPVIAPFWADVDVGIGGKVWYRETRNQNALDKANNEIRTYFPALRKFRASWVFIATWDNVGFYGASGEGEKKRNTFQAVLITDNVQSFVIFNYNKIEWTTGSNSGGETTTGLGGNPAQPAGQAGFNAGDNVTYFEIPGARKPAVVNLTLTSNVDIAGKWVFNVDSAQIKGGCSKSGSGSLLLTPNSGHVLGGQPIRVSGPCFYKADELWARLDEVNVTFPCRYVDLTYAECITPTIFKTGQLSLSLNIDGTGWNYTGKYTTKNIALMAPNVHRLDPKRWFINQSVNISWNAALIPSNIITVELLEYQKVDGVPSLKQVLNYTKVNQSSRFIFHFKLKDITNAGIIKVSARDAEANGSAIAIWSDVFPARWPDITRSLGWCNRWLARQDPKVKLTQKEACPCTRGQADGDTGRYQPDPFCNKGSKAKTNCLYRKGASDCIILNYKGSQAGTQVCCYGTDGELLYVDRGLEGGTLGKYHYRSQGNDSVAFFSYFDEDILPYLHCCQYSGRKSLCQQFLKFRPSVSCQGYSPPAAAQAAGDPHLVSLDGKNFTFNGEGEFVLLEDMNNSVIVQVRASRAKDVDGVVQNATLFTAAAMRIRNVSDVLEVRLDEEEIVQVLVNDQPQDLTSATSEFKGLTVYRNISANSTELTVVLTSVGVSVLMQATKELLNIIVMVGSQDLRNNLKGLLGNYNGNANDDFIARNGTVLPSGASMRAVHFDFGMTWKVRPEESMFKRVANEVTGGQLLIPEFIDEVDKQDLRNGTGDLCGNNLPCIYDYQVTGNEDIAKSIKSFNQRFEDIKKDIQKVIRCPPLSDLANGTLTVSGLSNGSTAVVKCDEGFEAVNGQTRLVCLPTEKWSGTLPSCAKPVVPPHATLGQYHVAFIGAGAAGVVLVIIIVTVAVCRYRKRRKRKKQDDGSSREDIELPNIFVPSRHIPASVFENQEFVESLQHLGESGSFKIPRPTYVDPDIHTQYFF